MTGLTKESAARSVGGKGIDSSADRVSRRLEVDESVSAKKRVADISVEGWVRQLGCGSEPCVYG